MKKEYLKFSESERLMLEKLDIMHEDIKKKCESCPTTTGLKYHWIVIGAVTLCASGWMGWITSALYAHTTGAK